MSDIQEEQKRLYKKAEENDLLIEIEKYKEIEKYLIKENEILLYRINKAIEYIEKYVSYYDMEGDLRNRLLDILQGDNK